MHLRKNGTPFYIGKGRGRRAISKNRNAWWKNVVKKEYPDTLKPEVVFLRTGLDEETALGVEKFWISVFGREDTDEDGILINLCDGGRGSSGFKLSEEAKRRISIGNKGKKRSKEAREHLSKIASQRIGPKNNRFGAKLTEEHKKILVDSAAKRHRSEEERLKSAIQRGAKPIYLLSPSGNVVEVINKRDFCIKNNIDNASLYSLIAGKVKTAKGWSIAPSKQNHSFRME